MKVRTIQSVSTGEGEKESYYPIGTLLDMPQDEAARLVRLGAAVPEKESQVIDKKRKK